MSRREFITLLGSAAAWPLAARAQQGERVRRVGVLFVLDEGDPEARLRTSAFQNELRDHGWINGRNISIDYRWGVGDPQVIRAHATELVALKSDVIVAGSTSALAPLHRGTRTIPIVFVQVADPVGAGFVTSLSRPGGNITGFSQYEFGVGAKWPELLKQIAPSVTRAAFIYDPANPTGANYLDTVKAAAASIGVSVSSAPVQNRDEIEHKIEVIAREPGGGLIVQPGPVTSANRDVIVASAARHRLPAVYAYRYFVTSGGLASYGIDNIDLLRRAASYVDRILKGEKPADLPVAAADKV